MESRSPGRDERKDGLEAEKLHLPTRQAHPQHPLTAEQVTERVQRPHVRQQLAHVTTVLAVQTWSGNAGARGPDRVANEQSSS